MEYPEQTLFSDQKVMLTAYALDITQLVLFPATSQADTCSSPENAISTIISVEASEERTPAASASSIKSRPTMNELRPILGNVPFRKPHSWRADPASYSQASKPRSGGLNKWLAFKGMPDTSVPLSTTRDWLTVVVHGPKFVSECSLGRIRLMSLWKHAPDPGICGRNSRLLQHSLPYPRPETS